jgi:hypothetical protein
MRKNPLQLILDEICIEIELFEMFIGSKNDKVRSVLEMQAKLNRQKTETFIILRRLELYDKYFQVENLISK